MRLQEDRPGYLHFTREGSEGAAQTAAPSGASWVPLRITALSRRMLKLSEGQVRPSDRQRPPTSRTEHRGSESHLRRWRDRVRGSD
jgi:hypothetical protein